MRALAEFIMRGRTQAAIVALLGTAVPVLTPATIALVSLRKGPANGLMVLLWGLLPMLVYLALGQAPLMPILATSGLLVAFMAAVILRNSISWAYTLMGIVALSSLAGLLQILIIPELLAEMTRTVAEMMEQMLSEAGTSFVAPGQVFLVGMIAYTAALSSLFALLLARWWQAALYNPGGFAEEFQQLRVNALQAVVCAGAALYCFTQSVDYTTWAVLFVLPLLVTGIAIVHRFFTVRRLGMHWVVVFYLLLIFFKPMTQLLVIVAFLDTWLNFRGRFKPKG
jgi:hypothetical protein